MESLNTLIEYGNPAVIGSNLRKVLFDYMETELKIGTTVYFEELLPQLNYLFNFLEEAAQAKENPVQSLLKEHTSLDDDNCAPWLFNDDVLYRVTAFLVATLQPERIYRVTHQPLEQQQPITDFVIVLPDARHEKPFSEYETLIEAGCLLGTQLSFSLHQSSHVNTSVTEGHVFYSLVCTRQNLLYWSTHKKWPVTEKDKLDTIKQNAFNSFQNNFSRAEAFFQNAVHSMQNENYLLTAFFLQQAVELCCRAILTALTGHNKKTHSIASLKKHCRRCTPLLDQVFPGDTEEEMRLMKLLDDAYISSRYDHEFSPAKQELEILLEKVSRLHEAAPLSIKQRLEFPV